MLKSESTHDSNLKITSLSLLPTPHPPYNYLLPEEGCQSQELGEELSLDLSAQSSERMKVNWMFNSLKCFWKESGNLILKGEMRKGHIYVYGLYYVLWAKVSSMISNYTDPHLSKVNFLHTLPDILWHITGKKLT